MAGRIENKKDEKIDGWLNGYKFVLKRQMDAYMDRTTIEGWLDGLTNG